VREATTVLEPETVILDETILDDTLRCNLCDQGAEWRWQMQCCPKATQFCTTHDQWFMKIKTEQLGNPLIRHTCETGCGHVFGYKPLFDTVYRRHPI
jgi:hypothetical protein